MAKRALPFVMVLAVLATWRQSVACGSVDVLSRMYLYGNPISKTRALEWLAGGKCGKPDLVMLSYRGEASDKALLAMLRGLVAKGRQLQIGARIFYAYRCLPGAEFERGYAEVRKALAAAAGRGKRCGGTAALAHRHPRRDAPPHSERPVAGDGACPQRQRGGGDRPRRPVGAGADLARRTRLDAARLARALRLTIERI